MPARTLILLRPDLPAEKELQDQLQRAVQGALAERADRLRDSVLVARPGKRDLGDLSGGSMRPENIVCWSRPRMWSS
ncbi:MAG: hypothetical protein IPO79_15995 [Flavobacteriales bacterium]|nr:hypothetical protein [Flavobacteriales bacterium]